MAFFAINSPPNAVGLSSTNVPEMIGGHALLVGLTEILQLTVCFRSVMSSEKRSPERSKRVT
jgi:hypothetical protein